MQDIRKILEEVKDVSKKKKIILDTDTYNEVDDQFALAWALLSKKVKLLSVNAAPFKNNRSTSAKDGMEKSYNEILRIMKLMGKEKAVPVYKGSTEWLSDKNTPVKSDAAKNIVKTVMGSKERVYIVAIGAITNVASAILMQPEIVEKACVVWLGGHAHHWQHSREFNMVQDIKSAQVIFDSQIPLIQIPCCGVCDHLSTTVPELEYYLRGKGKICDYLTDIVRSYGENKPCWSKVIWDISAIAALALPEALDMAVIPTPMVSSNSCYSFDCARHHMIYVRSLNRDRIFAELFPLLAD